MPNDSFNVKMGKTHDAISVSYHESGHTIYSLLHFAKVENVQISENIEQNCFEGLTYYFLPEELSNINDSSLFNYIMNSYICINYAGMLAERQHFKNITGSKKIPKILKSGCEADFKEASRVIKEYSLVLPGKKRYNYKKKLINSTLKKLNEHWDAVVLVAHALFNNKKLNFLDLKTLLTKKSKNKEFWKNQFKLIKALYRSKTLDELKIKSILSL